MHHWLRASVYLASVTAACIALSICWPAAACSSGMGTAKSKPLWRPSDRVLAEWYQTMHINNLGMLKVKDASSIEVMKSWNTYKFCSLLGVADVVRRSESTLWREECWKIVQGPVSSYADTLSLLITDNRDTEPFLLNTPLQMFNYRSITPTFLSFYNFILNMFFLWKEISPHTQMTLLPHSTPRPFPHVI